ncbi:MAG TPA: hypothetical protein VE961_15090, partial [Pyrinomonadaceae bacterium]|nr:hypothetical protein [Pyrinomonadaceae bacterium]
MKFFDPNNPNEKKKMIAAAALGLVALIILGYVFFGGSSKPSTNTNNLAKTSPTPKPNSITGTINEPANPDECSYCVPINYSGNVPAASEANRNIFAFYIPPSPTPKPVYVPT